MRKIEWIEQQLEKAFKLAWIGDHEAALRSLDRLLYEEPGYGRLHYVLGVIYFDYANDFEKAEAHFRLAIKFNPGLASSYWFLGTLLHRDGRKEDAIEVFEAGFEAKRGGSVKGELRDSESKRFHNSER